MVDSTILGDKGSVSDTILNFEAHEMSGRIAFDTLKRMAEGHSTQEGFFDFLKPGEQEYIDSKFAGYELGGKTNAIQMTVSEAEAGGFQYTRMKGGKVRVHILPAKWKTAKSVIGRAIDAGVSYSDMGKTEIEKVLKDKAEPKSAWDKAKAGFSQVYQAWGSLSDAERDALRTKFYEFMGESE
jgi:hypothetical protein